MSIPACSAGASERLKKSQYASNVSNQPRPFQVTVQPSAPLRPRMRSTAICVSGMAHSCMDCAPARIFGRFKPDNAPVNERPQHAANVAFHRMNEERLGELIHAARKLEEFCGAATIKTLKQPALKLRLDCAHTHQRALGAAHQAV